MPKSKAFHSFESKLAYFDDDIELIDVLRDGVLARISHRPPASLAGWAGCHHHRSFAAMIA